MDGRVAITEGEVEILIHDQDSWRAASREIARAVCQSNGLVQQDELEDAIDVASASENHVMILAIHLREAVGSCSITRSQLATYPVEVQHLEKSVKAIRLAYLRGLERGIEEGIVRHVIRASDSEVDQPDFDPALVMRMQRYWSDIQEEVFSRRNSRGAPVRWTHPGMQHHY